MHSGVQLRSSPGTTTDPEADLEEQLAVTAERSCSVEDPPVEVRPGLRPFFHGKVPCPVCGGPGYYGHVPEDRLQAYLNGTLTNATIPCQRCAVRVSYEADRLRAEADPELERDGPVCYYDGKLPCPRCGGPGFEGLLPYTGTPLRPEDVPCQRCSDEMNA